MSTDILCPNPQRSHKRVLADIDSDALRVSKHARRSPPPLPTPSTHGQPSESSHPPPRPSPQSLGDLDARSAPPKKRRRLQPPNFEPNGDQHLQITRSGSAPPWPTCTPGSKHCRPQLPADSLIDAWISAVFSPEPSSISLPSDRPSTCPATVDVDKAKRTPPSLATIRLGHLSEWQAWYITSFVSRHALQQLHHFGLLGEADARRAEDVCKYTNIEATRVSSVRGRNCV